MRMMMQMWIPVEAGNHAAQTGSLGGSIQKMLESLKPEAAYFTTGPDGERGGIIVFDLEDTSHIPAIAEPLFLAFKAKLSFSPVMNAQDLASAIPAIEKAVRDHAKASSA